MAIKLIEYRVNGSKNKSHKRLTESFGNEDVYIVSLDEVIEGMGGNATDEDINNSLKIFNFIKHQLKAPRLQDLLYVRVSDELAWELEELSQAKNINSFKNSEVQILQMTTEDYGPIIFAIEKLDGVYVGNGMVIEAKGRNDGVVIRPIDAIEGYWKYFGRLRMH